MKIVFAGTPEFAIPSLTQLIQHHDVQAVITQPDKPAGRGQRVMQTPIKKLARQHGIPIFDAPINMLHDEITALTPDLIVVVAYGHILDQTILDIPRHGVINVHASLLPKHRGAAPIQAAILEGDRETGVTIMKMVRDMDAGPILAKQKIPIQAGDTAQTLHDQLAILGARLLHNVLAQGDFKATEQNHAHATYTKKITAADAELFIKTEPSERILMKIRAYYPWPGAFIKIKNEKRAGNKKYQRIKILRARSDRVTGDMQDHVPDGTWESGALPPFVLTDHKPALVCKDGKVVIVEEIQLEGKKKISGDDFARGYLLGGSARL